MIQEEAKRKQLELEAKAAAFDWWAEHQWMRFYAVSDGVEVRDITPAALSYKDGALMGSGDTKLAAVQDAMKRAGEK